MAETFQLNEAIQHVILRSTPVKILQLSNSNIFLDMLEISEIITPKLTGGNGA